MKSSQEDEKLYGPMQWHTLYNYRPVLPFHEMRRPYLQPISNNSRQHWLLPLQGKPHSGFYPSIGTLKFTTFAPTSWTIPAISSPWLRASETQRSGIFQSFGLLPDTTTFIKIWSALGEGIGDFTNSTFGPDFTIAWYMTNTVLELWKPVLELEEGRYFWILWSGLGTVSNGRTARNIIINQWCRLLNRYGPHCPASCRILDSISQLHPRIFGADGRYQWRFTGGMSRHVVGTSQH